VLRSPRAVPVVASVGGLRRRERPLHAAFRRPSNQPKRPDKMMAGAAGPSAELGRARLYLPPSKLGTSSVDASGVGSKHGDDSSGSGIKQKSEKHPIPQIWRCVNGSPAQTPATWGGASGNAVRRRHGAAAASVSPRLSLAQFETIGGPN
jgi:hypothetical protein